MCAKRYDASVPFTLISCCYTCLFVFFYLPTYFNTIISPLHYHLSSHTQSYFVPSSYTSIHKRTLRLVAPPASTRAPTRAKTTISKEAMSKIMSSCFFAWFKSPITTKLTDKWYIFNFRFCSRKTHVANNLYSSISIHFIHVLHSAGENVWHGRIRPVSAYSERVHALTRRRTKCTVLVYVSLFARCPQLSELLSVLCSSLCHQLSAAWSLLSFLISTLCNVLYFIIIPFLSQEFLLVVFIVSCPFSTQGQRTKSASEKKAPRTFQM